MSARVLPDAVTSIIILPTAKTDMFLRELDPALRAAHVLLTSRPINPHSTLIQIWGTREDVAAFMRLLGVADSLENVAA